METTDRKEIIEKDFITQKKRLDTLLYNEVLFEKINNNDELKIIYPFAFLFTSYYKGVTYLLSEKLYSSVFPIARSALECFANFSMLCECFNSPQFSEKYKILQGKDIIQICEIAKEEDDENTKEFLMKTIISKIREAGFDNIIESDNVEIKDIIKNIRKEIDNYEEYKTKQSALKSLDYLENVYGNNTKFAKTIYADLCNLLHNNISGIMERFCEKSEDKEVFCGEHYKAEMIIPIQEMFIVCGIYIENWLKNNILIA